LQAFFRSLGGSFGTALFGAVLGSRIAVEIAKRIPDTGGLSIGELTGSPEAIHALPEAIRVPLIEALSNSITASFKVAIPFGIVALALAIFMPELPLRDSAHVAAPEPIWGSPGSGRRAARRCP